MDKSLEAVLVALGVLIVVISAILIFNKVNASKKDPGTLFCAWKNDQELKMRKNEENRSTIMEVIGFLFLKNTGVQLILQQKTHA